MVAEMTSVDAAFLLFCAGAIIKLCLVMTQTESKVWNVIAGICVFPGVFKLFSLAIL